MKRTGFTWLPGLVWIGIAALASGCGDDATAPNPASFSGLVAWFDASSLSGFAEDDPVGTWPDRSGNGNDATQATAANQPLYKASLIGGKPGLSFDGADRLATGNVSLGPFSVFLVFSSTNQGMPLTHANVFSGNGHWLYTDEGCALDVRRGGLFSGKDVGAGWATDGVVRIATQTFDGTHAGSLLYINGAARALLECLSDQDPGTTPVSGPLGIGDIAAVGFPIIGSIAEIIVYDRVLDDGERQAIEAYLNAKYSVH